MNLSHICSIVISGICFFLTIKLVTIRREITDLEYDILNAINTKNKLGFDNYKKLFHIRNALEKQINVKNMSTIYIITPTNRRATQIAELTRLQNLLRNIPKVVWIVIEDSDIKSFLIKDFLMQSNLPFVHLNIRTTDFNLTSDQKLDGYRKHRGSEQRNLGIMWVKINSKHPEDTIYFADDDNSYKLDLFKEIRTIKRVGIWPVAFVDMASFAVNVEYLRQKPFAKFHVMSVGNYETMFLRDIVKVFELEAKGDNCQLLYAWHVQTKKLVNMSTTIDINYIKKSQD